LRSWALVFLLVTVFVAIALIPQFNQNVNVGVTDPIENVYMYEKSIDVLLMLLIGFGFLMVFVRKHGYSSVAITFLLMAISLPVYMLVRPYLWGYASALTITNISMLLFAEFAAASLLIAIGGPLGRLKMNQYLLIGLLFTPLYALNEWLLSSGTFIPYVFSVLVRGKIEVGDIANSSRAGRVAIGAAVANVTAGYSILIGASAGAIGVVGYTVIQPRLQKLTGGVDTCGVHNLHGMPGIFDGLIAAAFVALPLWQFTGIGLTVAFAIVMGLAVGFIVSKVGQKETPYDDKDEFILSEQ
jgi:ammonia channel protein AmtB